MQLNRRSAIGLVAMNALGATAALRAQIRQAQIQAPQKPTINSSGTPPGAQEMPGLDRREQESPGPMNERMRMNAEKTHNDDVT